MKRGGRMRNKRLEKDHIPVDKSVLPFGMHMHLRTHEDTKKIAAKLPCLVCGARGVQNAHIRWGHEAGGGQKPDDDLILPLCPRCHRLQECGGAEWLAENIAKKVARDICAKIEMRDDESNIFRFQEYIEDARSAP